MDREKHNLRTSFIAKIVIVGMLFQAFLAVFHVSAQALGQPGAISLFSQTIIICTAEGHQRITLDENGQPIPAKNSDSKSTSGKCPVCLSFVGNTPALDFEKFSALQPVPETVRSPVAQISFRDRTPLVRKGRDPPRI